jgi:hypothetical protein
MAGLADVRLVREGLPFEMDIQRLRERRQQSCFASAVVAALTFLLTFFYFVLRLYGESDGLHRDRPIVRYDNATIMTPMPCRYWQLRTLTAEHCSDTNRLEIMLAQSGRSASFVLPPAAIAGLVRYYKQCVVLGEPDYCDVPACRTNNKDCSIRGGSGLLFFLSPRFLLYAKYDYVNATLVNCSFSRPDGIIFSCVELDVVAAALLLEPIV